MNPLLREAIRYVLIGLGFGLIWAIIQYTKGSITDLNVLAGPVIVFGVMGLGLWGIRRAVIALRDR